jgi:hypothetical protein
VTGEATGIRLATDSKGERMMTDVACFCGCLYSFDGGAGACPRCGEVATVTTAAASASTGRNEPPVPVTREDRQDGPGSFREGGRELVSDLLADVGPAHFPRRMA